MDNAVINNRWMKNASCYYMITQLHDFAHHQDPTSDIIIQYLRDYAVFFLLFLSFFFTSALRVRGEKGIMQPLVRLFRCRCGWLILERSPCVNPRQENHQMTAAVLTWPTLWKIHSIRSLCDFLTLIQEEHPGEDLLARPLHVLSRQQRSPHLVQVMEAVAPRPAKKKKQLPDSVGNVTESWAAIKNVLLRSWFRTKKKHCSK